MKYVRIEAPLQIENKKATHQGIVLVAMIDNKGKIMLKEPAFGLLKITDDGKAIDQYPFSSLSRDKNLVLDFGSATGNDSRETPLNPQGDRFYQLDMTDQPLALGQILVLRGGEDRLVYKIDSIIGFEVSSK